MVFPTVYDFCNSLTRALERQNYRVLTADAYYCEGDKEDYSTAFSQCNIVVRASSESIDALVDIFPQLNFESEDITPLSTIFTGHGKGHNVRILARHDL